MTLSALTILNSYHLLGSTGDFTKTITALAARVQAEGDPGVLSYRFYVADSSARAVIDYAAPAAWISHHDIAMVWPEMKALHSVAQLDHVTFLGPMTDEIRAYLAKSGFIAEIESGFSFAAGFARDKNG